jgi:ribosomal protein S18 acetylase RimI-like enzyme
MSEAELTRVEPAYTIEALTPETWGAFADLAERNNGAGMGGCWCTWFHNATMAERRACGGDDWRGYKQRLVAEGRAHAALVLDGETAVGWCEYGAPEELPGIAHRKDVDHEGDPRPDYRLTCFFVDRRHRRNGVATAALDGALALIAAAGGGLVETYPQDNAGTTVNASFLYNATRAMFERAGFTYVRPKGKNHCIMRRVVEPA